MNNKKSKNMFEEIVNDIPKAQKAAKNAQNMRNKQTKENDSETKFMISKKAKGLPRTFYLHNEQVNKINHWKKKGYPLSEIIRYLIDNAPKDF